MKRNLLCHSLFCLLLCSSPMLSWGAVNPLSALIGKPAETQLKATAAPELTDEDIDANRLKLEARIAELRLQLLPEAVGALRKTHQAAATPQELDTWENLTHRLVGILEDHANTLIRLKNVRKANRDLAEEMKSWQGFAEKPPYSITMLDSLRDAIAAKQITLRSLEIILATVAGESDDFRNGLKSSRKEVRLAEEDVEKKTGKPGEARSKWLLILARLRDAVNEAGTVYTEARRLMLTEVQKGTQAEIDFLNQKLAAAREQYRFTEKDLEQKLQAIDDQLAQLQRELDQAMRDEDTARKLLDAAEGAVRQAQAVHAAQGSAKVPLDRLLKEQEQRQTLFTAADFRVQILKGMLHLLKDEKAVWNDRYLLAGDHGKQASGPELKRTKNELEVYARWKEFITARLASLQALIKSQQEKLSSASLPAADREDVRIVLAVYQSQETLLRRGDLLLNEYLPLVQRRDEETKHTQEQITLAGRVRGACAWISSQVGKIWLTELYVAEETIIADNKKIVRPRSVTVSKLVEAFLIVLVGSWVLRHLKKLLHWIATRRLKFGPNDAQLYVRLMTYLLFIGILVSALIFVNIPLAFFAFFGGALAIGIGFGAQTLINNFISGIILMFDRTIRMGDVVEIDGQRGRVASIGMRSSSIKRFDGVEMLVPNSHFLQQNVTNWTSSDKRVRYSVSVGVAYGSPTRETERVILAAVQAQQEVLRDPAAYVVFDNFADSSLNFTAYFWVELDPAVNSLVVFSDIRHRIGERLAEAGIEIPFPQRDLHLDADTPIEIKVITPT